MIKWASDSARREEDASTSAAPDATAGGAAVPADPSTADRLMLLADDFVCNKQNVDKSIVELRKQIYNQNIIHNDKRMFF